MRKSVIVTILFIVFAGSIFGWLWTEGPGKVQGASEKKTLVAYFDNVALLVPKAKVAVAGIVVGQVEAMETVPDRAPKLVKVTFTVDVKIADQMKSETLAAISQESFLGAKFLDLKPSTLGDDLRVEGGYGVVETEDYSDLFTTFASLSGKVDPILSEAELLLRRLRVDVLSDSNLERITSLLQNADTLVIDADKLVVETSASLNGEGGTFQRLDDLVTDLQGTLAQARGNLQTLADKASTALDSADGLMVTANSSVKDITSTVTNDVGPAATQLLNDTDNVVNSLPPKLDSTFGKLDRALVSADDLLNARELYATLYETRRLMQELQLLVISLRADPSQIVFGGPGASAEAESAGDDTQQRTGGRGAPYGN